jgi:isovaleryl-CoA dehydrogenase
MYVQLNSARSYVYAVARACDKGEVSRRVSSLSSCRFLRFYVDFADIVALQDCAGAILYSTEKAIDIALEAMQCLGGNGYINGAF